jgi:hypothetical protein
MLIPIIWIGVYPNPLLRRIEPSVIELIRQLEARRGVVEADLEVAPEPESETKPEPESKTETKLEAKPKPKSEAKLEPDSEPGYEGGSESAIPEDAEERL